MSKRVLFVATVLRGHILVFHMPYMQWFQQQGYEVHLCAGNDTGEASPVVPYCDRYIPMAFQRFPLHPGNGKVFKQLQALIEKEAYDLIHCHTPVGGMLGRLCARKARGRGTRVVYTAHGFHFFTGAKPVNWLLYYPAERWLSRFTDLLVTINGEDYRRAWRFHAGEKALVHGVGIDLERFRQRVDRAALRASLGIPEEAPLVITVGEHTPRKNHETVLRAVAAVPEAWLALCGVGQQQERLTLLAGELGIAHRVLFLGFRKDVEALLGMSDVFMFPSLQEGLPVALMEAMAAGLPCLVSQVRGNRDLIRQGEGGMLRPPRDAKGFAQDLAALLADQGLRQAMGTRNREVVATYGLPRVLDEMAALYQRQLAGGSPLSREAE